MAHFDKPTMFLPADKPALFNWINNELANARLSRELHDIGDYEFEKLVAICHYTVPDNALDISECFSDAAAAQGLAPIDKGPFAMFHMVWRNLTNTDGVVIDLDPVEPVFHKVLAPRLKYLNSQCGAHPDAPVQVGYLDDPNHFLAIGKAWVYLMADYGHHWAISSSHKF